MSWSERNDLLLMLQSMPSTHVRSTMTATSGDLWIAIVVEMSVAIGSNSYIDWTLMWKSNLTKLAYNYPVNFSHLIISIDSSRQSSSHTMVYERPTVLTILLILLILLIAALFILYICCLVCACKCLQCLHKKTTMTNGTPLRRMYIRFNLCMVYVKWP